MGRGASSHRFCSFPPPLGSAWQALTTTARFELLESDMDVNAGLFLDGKVCTLTPCKRGAGGKLDCSVMQPSLAAHLSHSDPCAWLTCVCVCVCVCACVCVCCVWVCACVNTPTIVQVTLDDLGEDAYDLLLRIASGHPSKGEVAGHHQVCSSEASLWSMCLSVCLCLCALCVPVRY